jgi:NNP family nitrate/nitrite transporter-like MFS transporter
MKVLPLVIFWGLWFLNFSIRSGFSPVLPLIEDSLNLSHGQAGGLFTSLAAGYSLSMLISGHFTPVWGCKRTIVSGFIGMAIVLLLLQWTQAYLAFHAIFFLVGLCAGTYNPAIIPIITETYEPRHWGKVIGVHDSGASLAVFAMPLLIAFGVRFFSWRVLLLILGVAGLLLLISFRKVAVEPPQARARQMVSYVDLLRRRSLWIMGCLWIFIGASCNGIYSILPLYLIKERGIDFDHANTLISVSRACGVFVSIAAGFLVDRYGVRKMLVFSLLSTGMSTIGLALASTPIPLLVTLFVQGTFSIVFFPAGLAAISMLTLLPERSMAIAFILFFGVTFGTGLSPLLLGLTADRFSFAAGILGLGICTTLATLLIEFLPEK